VPTSASGSRRFASPVAGRRLVAASVVRLCRGRTWQKGGSPGFGRRGAGSCHVAERRSVGWCLESSRYSNAGSARGGSPRASLVCHTRRAVSRCLRFGPRPLSPFPRHVRWHRGRPLSCVGPCARAGQHGHRAGRAARTRRRVVVGCRAPGRCESPETTNARSRDRCRLTSRRSGPAGDRRRRYGSNGGRFLQLGRGAVATSACLVGPISSARPVRRSTRNASRVVRHSDGCAAEQAVTADVVTLCGHRS